MDTIRRLLAALRRELWALLGEPRDLRDEDIEFLPMMAKKGLEKKP